MAAKLTVRLPETTIEKLREQSRIEGRSLNETVVLAIRRGLGERVSDDEWWRALGPIHGVPPARAYDEEEVERLIAELGPDRRALARGLMEELDWSRGEP